eukprot:6800483-Prorocentrum_lima.AAC.1
MANKASPRCRGSKLLCSISAELAEEEALDILLAFLSRVTGREPRGATGLARSPPTDVECGGKKGLRTFAESGPVRKSPGPRRTHQLISAILILPI